MQIMNSQTRTLQTFIRDGRPNMYGSIPVKTTSTSSYAARNGIYGKPSDTAFIRAMHVLPLRPLLHGRRNAQAFIRGFSGDARNVHTPAPGLNGVPWRVHQQSKTRPFVAPPYIPPPPEAALVRRPETQRPSSRHPVL